MAGLGITVTRPAYAQGTKPNCTTERAGFGDWNTVTFVTTTGTGAEISAQATPDRLIIHSADVSAANFKYFRNNEAERYEATLFYRQRPTTLDHVVAVRHSSGGTKETLITRFSFDEGRRMLTLRLDPLFPDRDHPMLRPGVLDVVVAYAATPVVTFKLNTPGFQEARAFTVAEADRLKKLHTQSQCEISRCFLTAACCDEIGLADDCFELRALRAFRDGPMQSMPGGPEDVAHYYSIAPAILAEIRRRGDTYRLTTLYATTILPSALAAHFGFNALTRRIYSRMMRTLERDYVHAATTRRDIEARMQEDA